ncbi:MAG: hypothetical protein H6548_11880 [Chitinophagales bacterium]|nr:hypothetical protein [Chitinophagales bacterium]MCB9019608.1 hypothetical protein [Chitinophagales bacterium]MCB9022810.1 hypothetical protein [Chitinophagales bacterium]HAE35117.1 hypothetical protein [Bacteroidota bacterium]HQU39382.1 hypothetical protein [Chitinophagales bacterium]
MKKLAYILICFPLLSSCDFLFGTTKDDVAAEIFEEGAIDPELIPSEVGYVPVLPFWTGFDHPVDIYCGYDEMIYVIDDNGLNVLDQAGNLHDIIYIQGASDVCQDRRLHTYVTGRVDVDVDDDGMPENLAAVYHLTGTATGNVQFIDTLIHPFCDESRNITSFRGTDDIAVEFTGVTTLADNTLHVSRTGPRNDLTGIARVDNTILFFDEDGNNTGYSNGLSPVSSNLRSSWNISSIAGFAAPPQSLAGISTSADFLITLEAEDAAYKVLWIQQNVDPEAGVTYGENAALAAFDLTKADRFLYEPGRFEAPADVYVAPDFTGYIFVVDSELDSLYQFTRRGYEGVNPPPGSTTTKQIIASFGGAGDGPFNFNEPSGVAYLRRVVYVADKGNGRICRYTLSTDLE